MGKCDSVLCLLAGGFPCAVNIIEKKKKSKIDKRVERASGTSHDKHEGDGKKI